jgi:hypothetical protein
VPLCTRARHSQFRDWVRRTRPRPSPTVTVGDDGARTRRATSESSATTRRYGLFGTRWCAVRRRYTRHSELRRFLRQGLACCGDREQLRPSTTVPRRDGLQRPAR